MPWFYDEQAGSCGVVWRVGGLEDKPRAGAMRN